MAEINTFKKTSACNCFNLRRAALSITELYNKILAPSGIKISQYSLLQHVKKLGPVNVSDLAIAMNLDRTTVVRNLKIMEKSGYVIDVSEKGTRSRQIQLTDSGYAVLHEAAKLWKEAQNYVLEYLGNEELDKLNTLLARIQNINA